MQVLFFTLHQSRLLVATQTCNRMKHENFIYHVKLDLILGTLRNGLKYDAREKY